MTPSRLDSPRVAVPDPALHITLANVAELARVQRPVVSTWRTRFASGDDAFPAPVSSEQGHDLFDPEAVAAWLVRTGHGNNPDALADAVAWAAPADLSFSDPQHLAELEALIALRAHSGDPLSTLAPSALREAAASADPADRWIASELTAHAQRPALWGAYVDRLVDAAYSPAGALDLAQARHATSAAGKGSAAPLSGSARELVTAIVVALLVRADESAALTLGPGIDPAWASTIARAAGEGTDVLVAAADESRSLRRRLSVDGVWVASQTTLRRVIVARVPTARDDVRAMLTTAERVALELTAQDAAVVIGPARALVDGCTPQEQRIRADILRSGRLRAVVRLPRGLVPAAPREALALWVLGSPTGVVALDERYTAVGDLLDVPLTRAARDDVVSDALAGMGSARDVRAHAFRFVRLLRTSSLIARDGSLVGSLARDAGSRAHAELVVRLERAASEVSGDVHPLPLAATEASTVASAPASVAELIAQGHLRVVSGVRLDAGIVGDAGLRVVSAADLDHPEGIGGRRVDQLDFASSHPAAALTRPGDVVFRTSPTACAWVDVDGSSIVEYPARILRVTTGDPGGLMPELVAADIAGQTAGPGAWRRWRLRRVAPTEAAVLRQALVEVARARSILLQRVQRLDHYVDLLAAGVTSGVVTLSVPDPAAHAASDPQ